VIVLPLVGVLIYLIARGSAMQERRTGRAFASSPYGDYYREPAGAHSTSDELAKLADLRQRGVIDDEEFNRAKIRVM
jgi:hypothetical protein